MRATCFSLVDDMPAFRDVFNDSSLFFLNRQKHVEKPQRVQSCVKQTILYTLL